MSQPLGKATDSGHRRLEHTDHFPFVSDPRELGCGAREIAAFNSMCCDRITAGTASTMPPTNQTMPTVK